MCNIMGFVVKVISYEHFTSPALKMYSYETWSTQFCSESHDAGYLKTTCHADVENKIV